MAGGDPAVLAAIAASRHRNSDFLGGAKGYVSHGGDADTPRPTGYASIEWMGWVEPNNAIVEIDTWAEIAAP